MYLFIKKNYLQPHSLLIAYDTHWMWSARLFTVVGLCLSARHSWAQLRYSANDQNGVVLWWHVTAVTLLYVRHCMFISRLQKPTAVY